MSAFKAECFQATYPGDTEYRAFTDASGALHVMELPSQNAVTLAGQSKARLIAELRDASDTRGYDDQQINAIHHWLLTRAFDRCAAA